MLFLTCQTSLTHSFVPQHVLNTSFLVYKHPTTWHNASLVYHFSPVRHLQHATPTVTRCDHTVSWLWKRPKDELLWKTSLNLSFLLARCLNTSSFPCKVPSTCSFFSCKMSSESTFLAQRPLNMLFLVCEMLHNMKILQYVSQNVVSFRQSVSTM